jgi:hypothetical protein
VLGYHVCSSRSTRTTSNTCSGAASVQTPANTGAGSFRGGTSSTGLSLTAAPAAPDACQHALEIRRGNSPHRHRHVAAGGMEGGRVAGRKRGRWRWCSWCRLRGWVGVYASSSVGHDGVTVVQSLKQVHTIGRHGINPHGGAADLHGSHNSSTTMTARTLKA